MNRFKKKLLIIIIVCIVLIIGVIIITKTFSCNKSESNNNQIYSLGDTFEFDNLMLTINPSYTFDIIKNDLSDINGYTVIKLPITIKNISKDNSNCLNMFFYSVLGSKGIKVDSASAYFNDSADFANELQPNEEYNKYLYFVYDGDGNYKIEFDNLSEKIQVDFEIIKDN